MKCSGARLQFVSDRTRAATEMRRALAPGGRLAVATWRSEEEVPIYKTLRSIAEQRLGPVQDARFSFGDGGELETLLEGAGLSNVRTRRLSRTIRFEDGGSFVRMNTMALIGMSKAGANMDEEERRRVLEAIFRRQRRSSGRVC